MAGPKALGVDPVTGEIVTLRKGPFGLYVQLGEAKEKSKEKSKEKPKRASLLTSMDPAELTLEQALGLLSLPREVGLHPTSGEMILAGIGRYGPYLKHGAAYTSLGPDEDLLTIGLNRAVTVIDEAPKRGERTSQVLRALGDHPNDGKPVTLNKGRYGPYVKHGRINASIPKGANEDDVTLEQALELISARAAKGGSKAKSKAKPKAKKATKRAGAKTTKPTKSKKKAAPATADA